MNIKIGYEGIKEYPGHVMHGSFCSCPECRPKTSSSSKAEKSPTEKNLNTIVTR